MRIFVRLIYLAPVILAAGFLGGQAAQAAAPATLYVDQSSPSCSDSGPGSQAAPFCTIQAAANVVTAGQTVAIEGGKDGLSARYGESVTVRNSGTPSAPITFAAVLDPPNPPPYLFPSSGPAFTLDHVHDVTISHLDLQHWGNADGVDVTGSQNVTLDSLYINQDGAPTALPTGVTIDGASAGVTVSRSQIFESFGYGVRSQPGAQQVTVTGNFIATSEAGLGEIGLSGTSGAAVTGNSLTGTCGAGIRLDGGSSAVVENNFGAALAPNSICPAPATVLLVAHDSAAGVQAGYNAFRAVSPSTEYSWDGTDYQAAAAFQAATGQGTHDIDQTAFWPSRAVPPEGSPLIDSADCSAPGEVSTDLQGHARVDDPLVADAGTGTCHADRGAFERPDGLSPGFATTALKGPAPLDVTATAPAAQTSGWNEPVTYTADFGDGGGPVTVAAGGTVSHTYTTPGRYAITFTAADTGGSVAAVTVGVVAGTPAAPAVSLTASPETGGQPLAIAADEVTFQIPATPDDWELVSRTLAFGDGTSAAIGTNASWTYLYGQPGSYTATLTETDLLGRTSTATASITVGDQYVPAGPFKDYTGTVGAHQVLKLSASALHAVAWGTDRAALRVMVASPAASGFVTVYPDGTARPADASLDFARGQSMSNLVWAKPGASPVDFYNGSGSSVRLTVDTVGTQLGGGQSGDTYVAAGPVRVLDTRSGLGGRKGPVPAHGRVTFAVAGSHGVPANAAAAVLAVTATGGRAGGYLTAYGHGGTDPGTPDVSWSAGRARTGLEVVPLTDGSVTVHNASGGTVNVLADLAGYLSYRGTNAVFLPSADRAGTATIAAKHALKVKIAGMPGIPGSGVTAVAVDLTATGAAAAGSLTGYPDGAANPLTSALSFSAGQAGAAAAIVPVGADGSIELYNGSSGPVSVRLDLAGVYYRYPSVP